MRFAAIGGGAVAVLGLGYLLTGSLGRDGEPGTPSSDPPAVAEVPSLGDATTPEVSGEASELTGEEDLETAADETEDSALEAAEPKADEEVAATEPAPPRPATPTASPKAPAAPKNDLSKDLDVARDKLNAGLLAQAQQDLEDLLGREPQPSVAAPAYLLLGRTLDRQGSAEAARATYVELGSRFGDTPEAAEGAYRGAKILQAEGGRDNLMEASVALGQMADRYAQSPWAPRALADKAELEADLKLTTRDLELKQQVPTALTTYRDLVTRYPSHTSAEAAWWALGEMYADLKRFDLAAEAFSSLGRAFPSTRHEAWWRAGQLYDRRLDNKDEAIAAYERVPEGTRRHGDARKRINKLSR